MGKRGRKPTPTKLRLVTGQTGGGRPVRKFEPEPSLPDALPRAPDWLKPLAVARWNELVEGLYLTGLLTEVDLGTFAVYCECWGSYRRSLDDYEKLAALDPDTHAVMVRAKTGTAMVNPLVVQINKLRDQLARLGAELGLNPSARSNIDVGKGGSEDPIARKYNLA